MAVNSVSSTSNLPLPTNNAVNERRLEEQRAQRLQEQQQRDQQVERAERDQQQLQETRRSEQTQQTEQQDFLTLQQLRAEAANENRPSRGTPAPGSNINVTA
jgi:predicted solute-binding protein